MKYSEVIKALEENPSKKFEAFSYGDRYVMELDACNYFVFRVFTPEGVEVDKFSPRGSFNDNVKSTREWHEVKIPITYQKAFERWVQGYKVWFESKSGHEYEVDPVEFKFDDGGIISRNNVEFGTWYTEEVEAF